jgi:ParB family chromosome partitioning protein
MTARKTAKDLRAGLASLYAGAVGPVAARRDEAPAQPAADLGSRGGAPALFVEEQKRGLLQENEALRAELAQLREDGGADVLLEPDFVLDRYPPDRVREAFADASFAELVRSIEMNGQDQPILVRPHPSLRNHYEIAYGRRRREACRRLGKPVRARVKPLSDEALLRVMIRENEERAPLSLYERGAFVRRLAEQEKLSVRALAAALGISAGYVSRLMRLPVLPEELGALIGDPRPLSMRVLEELAGVVADATVVERVLNRWGSLRPATSPELRARQVIRLASEADASGPAPAEHMPSRKLRSMDGRTIGTARRGRDGGWTVELSPDLAEDEVERLLASLTGALTPPA